MGECLFCGLDPYHYVNNGLGMVPVAVNCCDLGVELFDRREPRETIQIPWGDFIKVADQLRTKRDEIQRLQDFLSDHDLLDKFFAISSKDTPLPFHDETMDGLNALTIRKEK